jgi:hypothetical protein
MTIEDRLVYQVVLLFHPEKQVIAEYMPRLEQEIADPDNDDNYMIDDAVSILDIKAKFTQYRASLRRFRCSAGQFFSLLRLRNAKLENVNEDEEENKVENGYVDSLESD